MNRSLILIGAALTLAAVFPAAAQDAQTPADVCAAAAPLETNPGLQFAAPEQVLDPALDYRAVFCTDAGAVYVDLFEDYTPITVNNFVFLAEQGYYDQTIFHRVIPDFMAQAGDPTATGAGGPGYQFEDEFAAFLTFDRPGLLAMANAGAGTNGSQFFITTAVTDWLNYAHTIFGEVIEGQDNVLAVQVRDPSDPSAPATTLQTIVIVTDPATVTTPESGTPVTIEEMQVAIDTLPADLLAQIPLNAEVSGTFTTDQLTDLPEAVTGLFAEQAHEYRAVVELTNGACDLAQIPFSSIRYTLDHFATTENAAAALSSGVLPELAGEAATSTESEDLGGTVYETAATGCDGVEASRALTFYQRGRFIVTAEAVYAAGSEFTGDVLLGQVVRDGVFERVFADILRREIR